MLLYSLCGRNMQYRSNAVTQEQEANLEHRSIVSIAQSLITCVSLTHFAQLALAQWL